MKQISVIIVSHLHRIYNVYLKKNYYLEHFRSAITIVLRKLDKSNYFTIAFYYFIAFFNTISKTFEFLLIKKISYLTKTYKLLSHTHIKAKRFILTKYALHYLVKKIYITWNKNKVITTLLLNVFEAFDNVLRLKLLHNFRSKRINKRIIKWIESFLGDRIIIFKIKKHKTNKIDITIRISQESLLSSILFLFYNVSLLKKLNSKNIEACNFVDDVILLIKKDNVKANCEQLFDIYENVYRKWARSHEAKFSFNKY